MRWRRNKSGARDTDFSWVPPTNLRQQQQQPPPHTTPIVETLSDNNDSSDSEIEEIIIDDNIPNVNQRPRRSRRLREQQQQQSPYNNLFPQQFSGPNGGDNIVITILGISLCAILFTSLTWLSLLVIGILNPALQTLKALEHHDKSLERRWLSYWTTSIFLLFLHRVFSFGLNWIPGYNLGLIYVLWWLSKDQAGNAERIHRGYVRPVFRRNEEVIDGVVEGVSNRIELVGKQLVVKVGKVVEPYARSLNAASQKYHRQLSGRRR